MTSVLIAALLVVLIAVAIGAVRRLLDTDGGPRTEPMPRAAEDWHPRLPSHPYVTGH
ncbi:MAG TPA: hypothetical protein VK925_05800 [Jiangellaceae bacterium]|nr:hypothetical protein [Jiangellaceae bacterium]